jgi:hypothetical protein
VILLIAGPVGAADVAYYHLYRFRLYERPQSVREEVTHLLRGALYPIMLALLLGGRPTGGLFWAAGALYAVDFANSLIDVYIEPKSREPGRVPPLELVIHAVGSTLLGLAAGTFFVLGWPSASQPSGLQPEARSPMLMMSGVGTVVMATGLLLFEAMLFFRACARRRREEEAGVTHRRAR